MLDAGCHDRRLATLPADAGALLQRDAVRSALSSGELGAADAFVAGLPRAIEELAACGVPETLVHGDFHHGNVIVSDDGSLVIIDWTDGCVAHPFFDLATFIDAAQRTEPRACARPTSMHGARRF